MITVKEIAGVYRTKQIEGISTDRILDAPSRVAHLFTELFGDATEEHFVTFYLNNKNKLVAYGLISKGTINETLVHPREIFKLAFLSNASTVLFAHNHPSGVVAPSREDVSVTKRLVEAGKLLGVPCIDHVVVNTENKSFYSIRENGDVAF